MLYSALGRLATRSVARASIRCSLSGTRVLYRGGAVRYLSTTSIRRSADVTASAAATGAAAPTGEQIASTASTVNEAVDTRNVEGGVETIYAGDYLPHNTEIYTDFLAMEQAEKIVDISAASEVTISQIAEGLSTDLLAASGVVPTLRDMDLGCYYTPVGLIQNLLDLLHNMGLPWWAAIASSTLLMKALLFPTVVKSQRASTITNNYLPEMQKLQHKLTEAKECGNALEVIRASNELANFMKTQKINPLEALLRVLIQAPVFISALWALRAMTNLPVESMKTGGIFWFTDLTVPDPYCILPLVTCVTVLVMIETGSDGIPRADNMKTMRYFVRGVPIIMFPILWNFPAAITCYWATSNFFSLGQTILLRQPAMRARFNIPALVKHEKTASQPSRGFVKDMKESYRNISLASEVSNRARVDEMRFKRAGTAPVVKTFKHPQKL